MVHLQKAAWLFARPPDVPGPAGSTEQDNVVETAGDFGKYHILAGHLPWAEYALQHVLDPVDMEFDGSWALNAILEGLLAAFAMVYSIPL